MGKKKHFAKAPFGQRQAIISSLSISFLINAILIACFIFLSFRLNPTIKIKTGELFVYFICHFACNFILLYILYTFSNRLIKTDKQKRKTATKMIVGTFLICGFLSPVFTQIQWWCIDMGTHSTGFNIFLSFNLIKDVILGVMMLFETGIRFSAYRTHQTLLVNQSLMRENIKTRYEALKNQLDPHFLFNSLNTLNGLIGIDDEKAHDYVDNLSSVFRYTLHSKTICKLSEEVEFVNAYVDLLKIRYGDNFVVHYNIEEKYKHYYLMPVSIQLLVENAIKHNIISNKKPLFILIETTDRNSVIVQNIINPKLNNTGGGGVGLANLTNRYSILFHKSISITNKEGIFIVEIPLIEKVENMNNSIDKSYKDEYCYC
ncbi:sensor histidine kinase [Bacteroides sp. 519]|uniref:sensor histidine kinase n=1 Tax=Bacteroides sp. 519 TaxID=2302937 RepID=UPI0013D16100|nr:histidine kinase [Bacteroides sp. 519]NDV56573.1 hypothetical protein [Bacteroides sp. 519]